MTTTTLWDFAQSLWHVTPLRRAVFRFQTEFQQPACLLIALCWLVATARVPTVELLKALREQADAGEQRMAPLRRLVQQTADVPEETEWHRALLKAQLEGEKLLLARLQALIEAQSLPQKKVSLDALILQALPEIGFCEGQTHLLAELVSAWKEWSEAGR